MKRALQKGLRVNANQSGLFVAQMWRLRAKSVYSPSILFEKA